MGLIQKTVETLRLATVEDILYIFMSAFQSRISEREIRALVAILRGSNYLVIGSEYGHLYNNLQKGTFLEIRRGFKGNETELRFEIAGLIAGDANVSSILSAVHRVA